MCGTDALYGGMQCVVLTCLYGGKCGTDVLYGRMCGTDVLYGGTAKPLLISMQDFFSKRSAFFAQVPA
eukprot:2823971-Rhodomonas_salina.1